MGSTFFNEINTNIDENFNHLHSSVASTELIFYTWGGSDSEDAYDIAADSSNNSYVVGWTRSFGAGDRDICLIKFNSSGVEWNRTFGGIYSDWGHSILLDSFDNIYITGYTESFGAGGSDIWLLKINSTGSVEWNHTWGGIYNEGGHGIAIDSLNNVYVSGYTGSFGEGGFDMCLVKFNSSGVVWNYTCGGSDKDLGFSVTLDPLENAYVVGDTKSFGTGNTDIYLVKFNSSGMVWNQTWGCVKDDHGREIIYDPSGDLYVTGYYDQPPNCYIPPDAGPIPQSLGLIKFDSEGIYQWNSTWKKGVYDYSYGMVMDSSGNAYVAGYTYTGAYGDYDWCLVRFNSSGIADWSCTWGTDLSESSRSVVLGPNKTAFATGYTLSYGAGGSDICMVQFLLGQCPVPEITSDGVIPGYDPVILISIAIVVSILLIKRIKNHNGKRKMQISKEYLKIEKHHNFILKANFLPKLFFYNSLGQYF